MPQPHTDDNTPAETPPDDLVLAVAHFIDEVLGDDEEEASASQTPILA